MSENSKSENLARRIQEQELAKLIRENQLGYKMYYIQVVAIVVAVGTLVMKILELGNGSPINNGG